MFKNLKNRLDSEAEKIKSSVQQYGGQVAAQVGQYRQAMNEAGSESGTSISKKFLSTVTGTPEKPNSTSSPEKDEENADTSMESSSAMMSEIPEADLLGLGLSDLAAENKPQGRERTLSVDSNQSTESTLASILHSLPNVLTSALETIPSDSESVASDAFSMRSTNDQANNTRLKQKLSTYKAKYRDAVHRHNKLVDEVNTTKKVLEQTQDEYLQKVEKLRNDRRILAEKLRDNAGNVELEKKNEEYKKMLEQCKIKIKSLQQEKEKNEKEHLISVGEDEDPKVIELNNRISKVEEEWTERINNSDQQHAITLATTKAEMHAALENKDSEIEQWRRKCGVLEQQDSDANQRWQTKVEQLQALNKALEVEKNEMIDKLSEAKQQGVKAILEEEERRRKELESLMSEKENQLIEEMEKIKEENEQLRLEMHTYKVQLEANESSQNEKFDETSEDLETIKIEKEAIEQKLAENVANFEMYKQEAEKTLQAAREQFKITQNECDEWREKYELRASDIDRITTVEFETTEGETRTREQFEELMEKMEVQRIEFAGEKEAVEEKCKAIEVDFEKYKNDKEREISEMKAAMLIKVDELQKELDETKRMREDIEKQFEEVTERAVKLRGELEENRNAHEVEKLEITSSLQSVNEKEETFKNEIETIREQLEAIRTEKERLEKDFEEYRNRTEQENSENAEKLKNQLEQLQKEKISNISELTAQLNTLTSERDSAKKSLEDAQNELENQKSLKEVMDKNESEVVQELNNQLENLKISKKEADVEFEKRMAEKDQEFLEKIKKMDSEILTKNEELKVLKNGSLEEEESVRRLEEEKLKDEEVIRKLEEEISKNSENLEKIQKLEQDVLQANTIHLEAVEKIRKLEGEMSGNLEKIQELEQEINQAKTGNSEADEKVRRLDEEKNEINKTIDELNGKYREIEEVLEKTKLARDETEKALNEEINCLTTTLETKSEEIEKIEKNAVESIENVKNVAQKQIDELNGKVQELEKENKEAEIRLIESQAAGNESLNQEIESWKSKFEETTNHLNEVKKENETLKLRIEQTEKEIEEHSEKVEMVKLELVQATQSSSSTELVSEKLKEEIEELKKKLAENNAENEKRLRENDEKIRVELTKGNEQKIHELSDLNEKMRLEFIAKEKVISDLRNELDNARKEFESSKKSAESKMSQESVILKATIEKLKMDINEMETKEQRAQKNRENEKNEEIRLKETFANELDNMRRIVEEKEQQYGELKGKAEKKLMKIKKELEDKAEEVRLEMEQKKNELETKLRESEAQIEKEISEKLSLEGRMWETEEVENKLAELKKKLENTEKSENELKSKNEGLEEDLKDSEHLREKLNDEQEKLKTKIESLEADVKRLTAANESKAVKQETDSRKVVRELQKEVKNLYLELNEKNQQYDVLEDELNKIKSEKGSTNGKNSVVEEDDRRSEFSFKEEISSLRQKLDASLHEADELRLQVNRQEETVKKTHVSNAANGGRKGPKTDDQGFHGIANPAEAEYLRNVLYRYMTNREELGKESVTLARVIGTVARFDDSQMKQVINSEEARQASWAASVGGTVSNVLTR